MGTMEERQTVDIVDHKYVFIHLVVLNDLVGVGVETSII